MKKLFIVLILVVIGALGAIFFMRGKISDAQKAKKATVVIPKFSKQAEAGKELFSANCQSCHGKNALGTDQGPSFLNQIYVPSHHPDQAFYMAVRNGVRAHHWRFGDMPSLNKTLTDAELFQIITYIRELQRANGIQ